MNVLVSSLGESPAVVTETVDALEREEGVKIDYVVTVGTSASKVGEASRILWKEFAGFEGGRVTYIHDQIEAEDLLTEEDHLEYLSKIAFHLRAYSPFADVYLSLAGGRKTMSAVMTIAAQIYGVKMLCHVVPLDKELEKWGNVCIWENLPPSKRQYVLHPPPDKVCFVRLPLISLFPLLDDILKALRGEGDVNPPALELLEGSGLIAREEGRLKTTPVGAQLLEVLSDIASLPQPCELRPDQKEVVIHDHGYAGKYDKVEQFARRLTLFPWTINVRTIEYGPKPRTRIRKIWDDGRIELEVKTTEFSAGIEVRTTAQTKAQTERVVEELKKFLNKYVNLR